MTRKYTSDAILPKIEAHLVDNERLLWMGKPSFRRMMTIPTSDGVEPIIITSLGLIVTVLMAFVLLSGLAGSPQVLSIALIVLLLLLTFAPVITQYLDAKHTIYAVTTHRALIIKDDEVTSFGAGDINKLTYQDAADGTGDIIFKTVVRERLMPNGYMAYPVEVEENIGFFGIANPRHIYGILLNTFRTSPTPLWQDVPDVALPERRTIASA